MTIDAHIAVIGGGLGGYTAALRANQNNKKVVLIEEDLIGGTCLNRGCIPTKVMVHAADVLKTIKQASKIGINVGHPTIDLAVLQNNKEEIVNTLRSGVEFLLAKAEIQVLRGRGCFIGTQRIEVKSADKKQLVKAEKIIIATGSKPASIPIEVIGDSNIWTSDDALNIKKLPKRILIIGGGAIGVEFAGIFNSLGAEVVLVEALPAILPNEDPELSSLLAEKMKLDGIKLLTSAKVNQVTAKAPGDFQIRLSSGSNIISDSADAVLFAVGRKPNSYELGLDKAGVKTNNGWILADECGLTSTKNIYAIGDVTGKGMYAHTAIHAGIIAADHASCLMQSSYPSPTPRCVFYSPEFAAVGLTETAVKEKGIPYVVGRFPFNFNGRAMTIGETEGLVKVIAEKDSAALLGVHILGPHASTLISEASLGLFMEATLDEYAFAVHPHPTIGEALQEACMVAMGRPIHAVKK